MISTPRLTRSAASAGSRSYSALGPAILNPDCSCFDKPVIEKPKPKALQLGGISNCAPLSNPTSGMARCCALAANGEVIVEPPRSLINLAPVHVIEVHQEPKAGSARNDIELAQISQQVSRGTVRSGVKKEVGGTCAASTTQATAPTWMTDLRNPTPPSPYRRLWPRSDWHVSTTFGRPFVSASAGLCLAKNINFGECQG